MHLTSSRPDINYFPVQLLSKFLHTPREKHLQGVVRVLRYLQCTKTRGIFFPSDNQLTLQGYTDSDWGAKSIDRNQLDLIAFY